MDLDCIPRSERKEVCLVRMELNCKKSLFSDFSWAYEFYHVCFWPSHIFRPHTWYTILQKPIGIIALLDEAWYTISSILLIGAFCFLCLLRCILSLSWFPIHVACFLNQLMKHLRTSCFRIVAPTLDWKGQNFLKQISLSPIMLARYVIGADTLLLEFCKSRDHLLN